MVTYRLALPSNLSQSHPIFHVSILMKYILDPSHVLQPQSVEVKENLMYDEEPVVIIDYQVCQLDSKTILMVKVLWRNNNVEEHMWVTEAEMRVAYPYLFSR